MAKDQDKAKDDVKDKADTNGHEADEKAEAKDETSKAKEKAEAKDETSKAKGEKAEAKDETSKAKGEKAEAKGEKAEAKDETSKAKEKAEAKGEKAEAKDEAEAKGEKAEAKGEKAEAKDEAEADEGPDSSEKDEDEEGDETSAPPSDRVVGASPARSAEIHAEAYSEAEAVALSEDAHNELAHITPVTLLFKVWGALMVFTILTVAASYVDFGGQTNLVVAMLIATIKASLVVVFFMHLRWDRRFHALTFLSGFLFVILFIGLALTDRAEYQPMIRAYQDAQAKVHGGVRLGPQP